MFESLRKMVKHNAAMRGVLALPLSVRRWHLTNQNRPLSIMLQRLAADVQGDICLNVKEFEGEFEVSPKSALFTRWVINGYYEPVLSDLFFSHVDPNRDVLDVGANIGFYTVGAARRLGSGRVLAIEPTTGAFERLRGNVTRNGLLEKVVLEKSLVSDRPGDAVINYIEGREEYSSMGDLAHPSLGEVEFSTEAVPAQTIDSLVEKHDLNPAIMKVDVEGGEFKVIFGAQETLRRCRPYILAECSDLLLAQQGSSSLLLREMLRDLGYKIVDPEAPNAKIGTKFNGDIFCIPT